MSIYLLRHGETIYQTEKKGLIYPLKESIESIGLTLNGRKMIEAVIPKIREASIDIIYASDFKRTRETAEIILKELKIECVFTDQLRDVNLGVYQGKPKELFYTNCPNFLKDFNTRPLMGESLNDVKIRMFNFINNLDNTKNSLIISHGEPLWLLSNPDENGKKENYISLGEFRKL
ncbi:MAG TPA: histidine phosphatase family protein [Candidatus Pacearchaeota archaeon]|jgi:broad specificity phosphatase PhoE|nr:histidine phosphatase family protein [Candidatus Pacearchaeota archaeon]